MRYGYFDDGKREYVITNPRTPVKWINYIGTLAFGGFVDHTGGALLCKGDPALNRIVKYIPQLPDAGFKGTTLYLRFPEGGGYRLFSAFYTPTLDAYDCYACHVGLGYSRIVTELYGIRTEATIFVPHDGTQEIRDIRITNLRDEPVELDAIPVVEYTHPDALKQFTNADWVPQTMQSAVVEEEGGLKILTQFPFMNKERQINYFTSNLPVSSFESDRSRFLGRYGTWAAPRALQEPELSNYEARRGDNVGALLHHLGTLAPDESRRLITQLGQAPSVEAARPEISRYRDPVAVEEALETLARTWDIYLARLQVQTPDEALDAMLNVHNPRQVYITMNWSRYLSLYQLGLGARGIGFRDSSQDVMGVVANAPREARALLRMLLQVQRRDGSAMHQFNPLTMEANRGEAVDEERPSYYGDDHLWIVLAVTAYLKETGDLELLTEILPFYEKDREERPLEAGTVLEHLERAVEFTRTHVGAHGLPLLGFADWNDTVNLRPGAESLFIANLYGTALLELIDLAEHLGEEEMAARYRQQYDEMRARVNEQGWDGEWYVRYFDANGDPIGSQTNVEGQIYTNAQSWPVISGFAPRERALTALDAVRTHLNTTNGIKLSTPGYDGFDPDKGGVTTYPPGAKENGGIFLHANPWVMIAEALVGRGDRAFEYYRQINPATRNERIEEFETEPYVYPQNILGDEHPQFGLARNSWLTGTASWTYQAGTRYILGIRPTYRGLQIDPAIPAAWDGFRVQREFRGAIYEIEVRNPDHVSSGVGTLIVDGEEIDGGSVPIFTDGEVHRVVVLLNAA
ncbi:MAG: GH36-type glycosyl hydrolase domain-containing protein [Anaerolineales bacterium]